MCTVNFREDFTWSLKNKMCVSGSCSHREALSPCICVPDIRLGEISSCFRRDSPLKWHFQVCGNQERACYLAWHCYAINCVKSSRFERPPFRNKPFFPHEYINLPLFIYLSQMFLLGGSPLTFRYSPGKPESPYLPREPSRWKSCRHTQVPQKKQFFVCRGLLALSPPLQCWGCKILPIITPHPSLLSFLCLSSSLPAPLAHRDCVWVFWLLFPQLFVNLWVSLWGKKKFPLLNL